VAAAGLQRLSASDSTLFSAILTSPAAEPLQLQYLQSTEIMRIQWCSPQQPNQLGRRLLLEPWSCGLC